MSTNSRIGILNEDGSVLSVYCHWDGYPSYVGGILLNHYSNQDKIREMMSHGDMSSIGPEIGEKHDFNGRPDDSCTFYGRDRGEEGVEAKLKKDEAEYSRTLSEQYMYLFKNGSWYVRLYRDDAFQKLTKKMTKSNTW